MWALRDSFLYSNTRMRICMNTMYFTKYFNSNSQVGCVDSLMSACSICAAYFASSISPCLSFLRSPLNVCVHAPLRLGYECAFEYSIPFPSHGRAADLTAKLRQHNYLFCTAGWLVKQLLRKLHRMRLLSGGQLCILRSCSVFLAGEFQRQAAPRGRGQVTGRRGAVASQGHDSLCWEQRSVFSSKVKERPWAVLGGNIHFIFTTTAAACVSFSFSHFCVFLHISAVSIFQRVLDE